jgi:two-component sensor histidine kinase
LGLCQGHAEAMNAKTEARLAALRLTGLLDSQPDPRFDKLTSLAADLLRVPVSLLSLVDTDRQFFMSSVGLPQPYATTRQTPLSHSFCQHVVATGEPLVVKDARTHPLVQSNLAVKDLGVIGYLGVPVRTPDGHVLGSFCVIDGEVRDWSAAEVQTVNNLAAVIEEHIALRADAAAAHQLASENDMRAREYHHRVKNTLAVSAALLSLTARNASSVQDLVTELNPRLMALSQAHDAHWTDSDNLDLRGLLTKLLLPYCPSGTVPDVDGPPVELRNNQITPACLIIHELATNSAKYGAFRNQRPVRVRWDRTTGDVLRLRWIEEVAGRVAQAKGFGGKLMTTSAKQLDGTLETTWADNGLEVVLSFPIDPPRQTPG